MATDRRQTLGKWGEELACAELVRRGYVILARRFRVRAGEIDIIARDADTLVFVEVKTRSDCRFGGGAAAVTFWKQRRLAHLASLFLAQAGWTMKPCRFDVVVVDLDTDTVRIEIFTNAFSAPTTSYV